MIRFAAISSTGRRGRASTRHEIDKRSTRRPANRSRCSRGSPSLRAKARRFSLAGGNR